MIPLRAIAQLLAVLLRHGLPLVGMLAYGWSAGQFLVCAVFNTTWPIGVIAATNIVVSDRLAARSAADVAPRSSDLLRVTAIALAVALVLGMLFGWIVVVAAAQGDAHTFDPSLLISVGMTIASGSVAAFTQYRADLAARLDEATRKQRDQPAIFALLASAAIVFMVSGHLAQLGGFALPVSVCVLTALFIVRDLRPDLLRRIVPLGGR